MAPLNLITKAVAYNLQSEVDFIEIEKRDVENLSLSYVDAIYAIGKLEIPSKLFMIVYKNNLHTVHERHLLYMAARDGNLNIIKQLNNSGLPIHDREYNFAGEWALSCSIIGGHLNVVQYLVDDGADLLDNYCKAMVLACSNGRLNIVKYIYETTGVFYDAQGLSPMIVSCKSGHLDIIKYIHKNRNNSNIENIFMLDIKWTLINTAINYGYLEILKYLHKKKCYYVPPVISDNGYFLNLLSKVHNNNHYEMYEFLISHYDDYGNLL